MLSDMPYGNTNTLYAMLDWQAEQLYEVLYEKTNTLHLRYATWGN